MSKLLCLTLLVMLLLACGPRCEKMDEAKVTDKTYDPGGQQPTYDAFTGQHGLEDTDPSYYLTLTGCDGQKTVTKPVSKSQYDATPIGDTGYTICCD